MNLKRLNAEIEGLTDGEVLIKQDIPEFLYHESNGIGSSALREASKSMAHFHHYFHQERNNTPEMILGSAIHTLILEPDLFFDRFSVAPDDLKPGNNKEWKEWKDEQELPFLTQIEYELAEEACASVEECASRYFSGGIAEQSYWRRDISGVILKARIDYQLNDLAIDLKSTKAESPQKFLNTIKYQYAIQDALYRRVTGISDFIFIGVCKQPPHQIYAARQKSDYTEAANKLITATIGKLQIAQEFNQYPLPPIEIMETQ